METLIKMVWQEQHLRFRPDQVTQFKDEYPDKSLSVVMRMLLDEFLGGQKDNINRISEIKDILKTKEREVRLLTLELDEIEATEHKLQMSSDVEADRQEYLKSNPKVLEMYHKSTISAQGYKILIDDLGFKNKNEVDQWLDGQK